jgi:hypothetical protein
LTWAVIIPEVTLTDSRHMLSQSARSSIEWETYSIYYNAAAASLSAYQGSKKRQRIAANAASLD